MHAFRSRYVDGYGWCVPNSRAIRLETHHQTAVRKQRKLGDPESISKQKQWTSFLEKGCHPPKWGTRSCCWNNKSDSSLSPHTAGHHFQPLADGSDNSNNSAKGINSNRSFRPDQGVIPVIIVLLSVGLGVYYAYGLTRGSTMVPQQLQAASSALTKILDLAWCDATV